MPDSIRVITAEELKAKLDSGDDLRLINALGEWQFRAKHIPGSENFANTDQALAAIRPDEDVVVYCSNPACHASQKLYKELVESGFTQVRRFEGGLEAWEDAGYRLDGEDV